MNENYLQLSGKVNIPNPLKHDHEYDIALRCEVIDEKKKPQGDGSFIHTFKVLPKGQVVIQNEEKQKMMSKESKKQSKILHGKIFHVGVERGIEDEDAYYIKVMKLFRSFAPELIDYAEKLSESS